MSDGCTVPWTRASRAFSTSSHKRADATYPQLLCGLGMSCVYSRELIAARSDLATSCSWLVQQAPRAQGFFEASQPNYRWRGTGASRVGRG
jgi:hypothetical protein